MPPHNRLLVLPADPGVQFEFIATADVADSDVPGWVENRLRCERAQCEAVGKTFMSWLKPGAVEAPNGRAFALWYASIGSETGKIGPIPPVFFGTVVFEARNANLDTTRVERFLRSSVALNFKFRGNHPTMEELAELLRAWRA